MFIKFQTKKGEDVVIKKTSIAKVAKEMDRTVVRCTGNVGIFSVKESVNEFFETYLQK